MNLYSCHACKVCGHRSPTFSFHFSWLLQIYLCSSGCFMTFVRETCRPPASDDELAACSYLLPVRALRYCNDQECAEVDVPPRYPVNMIEETAVALDLGLVLETVDITKMIELDKKFRDWTRTRFRKRVALEVDNEQCIRKWFMKTRWKINFAWKVPRVQQAVRYLAASHLSFHDKAVMTRLGIQKIIRDAVEHEMAARKTLIKSFSPKENMSELSCAHCIANHSDGWPRWMSFGGVSDHLASVHQKLFQRREDIATKKDYGFSK